MWINHGKNKRTRLQSMAANVFHTCPDVSQIPVAQGENGLVYCWKKAAKKKTPTVRSLWGKRWHFCQHRVITKRTLQEMIDFSLNTVRRTRGCETPKESYVKMDFFFKKKRKKRLWTKKEWRRVLADFSRESSIIERASIVPLSSSQCHCDTPCLISRRRDTIHASTSAPGGDQRRGERSTASLCNG